VPEGAEGMVDLGQVHDILDVAPLSDKGGQAVLQHDVISDKYEMIFSGLAMDFKITFRAQPRGPAEPLPERRVNGQPAQGLEQRLLVPARREQASVLSASISGMPFTAVVTTASPQAMYSSKTLEILHRRSA